MSGMLQALLMSSASAPAPGVGDMFVISTWSGNASSRTITTNAFAPSAAWIQTLTGGVANGLFDTSRGVTKMISTNAGAAQSTQLGSLTAFNATSVDLGSSSYVNASGSDYVGMFLKEAAGFFDVVTYTGNGANRTIAHSLGSVPGMILVRILTASDAFYAYHRSLGGTKYIPFGPTAGASSTSSTFWNNTTATSSVFSLGTAGVINGSGDSFVAWLMGHDTSSSGYTACGSFTTDGSGNATVSGWAWEPQMVLIIPDASANRRLLDTTRGWDNTTADASLLANTTAAQATGTNYGGPTSDGFTYSDATLPSTTFLYWAVRKP